VPALEANPRLVVLLVGPSADVEWNSARERFPQRVFHLGRLDDPYPIYAAADLYLDSFPVSGATSILEAAALGLPVLCPPAYEGHLQVHQANSPGLDGSGAATRSRENWLESLKRLVDRPQLRADLGRRAQRSVLGAHSGPSWDDALQSLYERARSIGPASLDEYPARIEDDEYGAHLVPFMHSTSDGHEGVAACSAVIADAIDQQLQCDIYVAAHRDGAKPFSIRIGTGWDEHPAWMARLAELAHRYPQLAVSLPLAGDDDGTGERSVAQLTEIFASVGRDIEQSGDLSLDPLEPARTAPMISGTLPFTSASLDLVESHLASPSWD
jgi:hypothetical protein